MEAAGKKAGHGGGLSNKHYSPLTKTSPADLLCDPYRHRMVFFWKECYSHHPLPVCSALSVRINKEKKKRGQRSVLTMVFNGLQHPVPSHSRNGLHSGPSPLSSAKCLLNLVKYAGELPSSRTWMHHQPSPHGRLAIKALSFCFHHELSPVHFLYTVHQIFHLCSFLLYFFL